jgi:hypothetical protein
MSLRAAVTLLALAAALAPGAAAGLFGAAPSKETVVWVPAEGFSDWAKLDALLSRGNDLKLTIALTPSMLTPEAKKVMAAWMFAGRVEGALRLEGDPLLPLIAEDARAPRPDDVTARLGEEREKWRVAFGSAPVGLVPGAGAVSPALFDAFRALGVGWAATGEYSGSTTAWAASGTLALVPLRAPRTQGAELSAADLSLDGAPGAFVVDEADGLVPPGSLLRLLDGASSRPQAGWGTVSEALAEKDGDLRPAAKTARWPAWTGGLEPWTSGPRAQAAWALYRDAALAVDRYQNSGSADLKALEGASEELYAAQANRFYRELPAGEADAAARAFRQRLLGVYRRLKQTPPEELFAEGPAAGSEDLPTGVRVTQGPDWVQFDNPSASFGRAPAGFSLEGAAPGKAFTLESLRVLAGDEGTSLVFRMGALDASAPLSPRPDAAPDLGRLVLEADFDLNHVAGAGSARLLFDHGTYVMARDAWEFALTVSAWGAFLYKANPLGSPQKIARLAVLADPSSREVRVTIPRSLLRGSVTRWGYVVTAAAADPATAKDGQPVKPRREADETTVLGLLAPLRQQKALAAAKPGSHPRLSAVRAD